MTEKCYDEGTLQAFIDGELASDRLESVARHAATCGACAYLLREAEEEATFAFSALGENFNQLVPTERIRANLYQEIAKIENRRPSVWQKIFGGSFSFTNPSLAAFASLLLVFGIFVTLFIYRSANQTTMQVAQSEPRKTVVNQNPIENPTSPNNDAGIVAASEKEEEAPNPEVVNPSRRIAPTSEFVVQKAAYKPPVKPVDNRVGRIVSEPIDRKPAKNSLLPAEQSYVKTIQALTETVNARKNAVLRPSEQVAFEKNLAVVNQAITTMRQEVRKNPGNEAAKQILRSSYQNKIDLLNSVAEKQEMMALR